jgi:hypothetical protein
MAELVNPFLNCYIWEIKQWPKHGNNLNYHALNDIYHYNSLETDLETKKQL